MQKVKLNIEIMEISAAGRHVIARAVNDAEASRVIGFLRPTGSMYETGIRRIGASGNLSEGLDLSEGKWTLYDLSGLGAIRLLQCFRLGLESLLLPGYKAAFPERVFRWVDANNPKAVRSAIYHALPSQGTSDKENRIFESICARLKKENLDCAAQEQGPWMEKWFPYPGCPWLSQELFAIIFSAAWQQTMDYQKWAPFVPPAEIVEEKTVAVASRPVAPSATRKYYAVARGKMTGIFTDAGMYNKATRGFPNALARAFKDKTEAEAWLSSVRGAKIVAAQTQKETREERWRRQNEAILAANRAAMPVAMPRAAAPKTTDPNELLAERLDFLFVLKKLPSGDVSAEDIPAPDGLKPETKNFLAYGNSIGRDYFKECLALVRRHWAAYRSLSAKEIASGWGRLCGIPSAYRVLVKDLVACCRRNIEGYPKDAKNPQPASGEPAPALQTDLARMLAEALDAKQSGNEEGANTTAKTVPAATPRKEKKQKAGNRKPPIQKNATAEAAQHIPNLPAPSAHGMRPNSGAPFEPAAARLHPVFRGIQFDKHVFRNVPEESQRRFRKTFAHRLRKLEQIFHGDRRAADNDFRLVAPNGHRVFKRRVGKQRLSMVFKDGILTLLKISSHDRQMADIRNLRGKSVGYVYYDMEEFLRQMEAWPKASEDTRLSFGDYLASPRHFVFDEDQKSIIESGEKAENLSVIGNAGAGKSVVGLKWLNDELSKPGHDCLYLTMSENLVYTLGFEFQKSRADERKRSRADIRTTFDFLRENFKKRYPKTPEKNLLNAAQSFALFRRFWAEKIDWAQFWNCKDNRFFLQSEEATLLAAWREIHGIIKGAVPIGVDYGNLGALPEALPEDAYKERLRQERKDSVRGVLWIDTLYRVYEKYQTYLRRRQLLDDNDIARMILGTPPDKSKKYAAAFVDECQDLTQMELLAIFHLLGGVKVKRMSSDRCQMVQPTYFDEGWMRTTANEYGRRLGQAMEETGWKPRYLHYNYRSSRSIIDFQNYTVQYLRYNDILTLKQLETEEIRVPPLTPSGVRPIWIAPSEENRQSLIHDLWKKLDASELQTIFAYQGSPSKKDFPLGESGTVTEVLNCKGMEYPSVLLWNILSETRFDPVMAWKYFYVGATRANHCLLIYENEATEGTRIYDFLSDAAELGLIDRCDRLLAQSGQGSLTWLGYLYQCVSENADENRMETAENALNFGQYELALNIFSQEGKDKNMIAYCRGKARENRGDFHQALENYMALGEDWNDRGRTRRNSVDTMLNHPDIGGSEYLGAYFLSGQGDEDLIPRAKEAWLSKYGTSAGFYEALFDALSLYPATAEPLHRWTGSMIAKCGAGMEKIRRRAAGWEG